MLGQIINLPTKNSDGVIYGFDNNVYYFTDEDSNKNTYLDIGVEIDFIQRESIKGNQKKFRTYVTINKSNGRHLNIEDCQIFITDEKNPKNLNVFESIKSYRIFGESISKEQALQELIQVAKSCNANAIIDVKLNIIFNSVKSFLLYQYSGTLAQAERIEKETTPCNAIPPKPIQINKKLIKKYSPNEYTKHALRLLMIIFILFFLPLWGQILMDYSNIIPRIITVPAGLFIFICSFLIYVNINPHINCGYLTKKTVDNNN
jgi:hypothetical protein